MTEAEPIKQTIARQLARQGLGRVAAAAWLCQRANEQAEGRFQAVKFRDGTLTVSVPDSLRAYELRARRDEILAEIRHALGAQATHLKRLRVVIREESSAAREKS